MTYHGPGGTWPRTWTQQAYGHHDARYAQVADDFSGHSSHAASQSSTDGSIHQERYTRSETLQYPYNEQGVPRAAYVQGTAASTGGYHSQASTNSFASGAQSIPYNNTVPQYSQQSQSWPQTLTGEPAMVYPRVYTTPAEYVSSPVPSVTPMAIATNLDHVSQSAWPGGLPSATSPSSGSHMITGRSSINNAEYAVPCPYNCGTVLTGVHAVGNMTRHLKSQNCVGSGREKPKYVCPVQGCDKRYIRSDGLKVHLRKRHDISHMPERSIHLEHDESGLDYS